MAATHIVPETTTVLTPTEALDSLWHAHQDVIGGPCPIPLLEVLGAQWAEETGRGHSMHNFNFGNLRGHGPDGATMAIKGADEIVDGKRITGTEAEEGFAAYRDRFDGARAFVRYLGTATKPGQPNRYAAAWDAACRGDVDTYCAEIRKHGYFTADLGVYTRAMHQHVAWLRAGPLPTFLAYLSPDTRPEPFPLPEKDT